MFQRILLCFTLIMKKGQNGLVVKVVAEGHYLDTYGSVREEILDPRKRRHLQVIHIDESEAQRFPNGWVERITVVLRKRIDCSACGQSSDCAKVPGAGVRLSEVWACKGCWDDEMRRRRNARPRGKSLLPHSWPKKRQITETRRFVPPEANDCSERSESRD